MKKNILSIIFALFVTFFSSTTFAAESADAYIKAKYSLIIHGPNPISEVNNMIDFESFVKNSLGEHETQVTNEEKEILRYLMEKIVSKSLSSRLRSMKNYDVIWNGSESEDDVEIVNSTFIPKGKNSDEGTDVDYHVKKIDASYKVVDIIIDDVSTVTSYRQQFHKVITKEGVKSLIKKMAKKAGVTEEDYGC